MEEYMEKPFVIRVDTLSRSDSQYLSRIMDREYLNRTFVDVLEKIVDPTPDNFHDTEYSSSDMEKVRALKADMKSAARAYEQLTLYVYQRDPDLEPIVANMFDKISDYGEEIIKTIEYQSPDGELRPALSIDIAVRYDSSGASKNDSSNDISGFLL